MQNLDQRQKTKNDINLYCSLVVFIILGSNMISQMFWARNNIVVL